MSYEENNQTGFSVTKNHKIILKKQSGITGQRYERIEDRNEAFHNRTRNLFVAGGLRQIAHFPFYDLQTSEKLEEEAIEKCISVEILENGGVQLYRCAPVQSLQYDRVTALIVNTDDDTVSCVYSLGSSCEDDYIYAKCKHIYYEKLDLKNINYIFVIGMWVMKLPSSLYFEKQSIEDALLLEGFTEESKGVFRWKKKMPFTVLVNDSGQIERIMIPIQTIDKKLWVDRFNNERKENNNTISYTFHATDNARNEHTLMLSRRDNTENKNWDVSSSKTNYLLNLPRCISDFLDQPR